MSESDQLMLQLYEAKRSQTRLPKSADIRSDGLMKRLKDGRVGMTTGNKISSFTASANVPCYSAEDENNRRKASLESFMIGKLNESSYDFDFEGTKWA